MFLPLQTLRSCEIDSSASKVNYTRDLSLDRPAAPSSRRTSYAVPLNNGICSAPGTLNALTVLRSRAAHGRVKSLCPTDAADSTL
jgi:hypothetical protein